MAIQLIDTVTPDIGLKTVADKLNNNFTDPSHAASRLVTSSTTDTTPERLLKVGDFGVGSTTRSLPVSDIKDSVSGLFYAASTSTKFPAAMSTIVARGIRSFAIAARNKEAHIHTWGDGEPDESYRLYHTGNTIVDSNGFIKQA